MQGSTTAVDQSAFHMLHTPVPITWRRSIEVFRVVSGLLTLLLYVFFPVSYSIVVIPLTAIYSAWSGYTLVRDRSWSLRWPLLQISFDTGVLLMCSANPSEAALWLSSVVCLHLLLLTALLRDIQVVLAVVGVTAFFSLAVDPERAYRLWPMLLLGGTLASFFAVYRGLLERRLSAALRRSVLSRSEAELAREQERQRIAADFHDGPLQSFISFQVRLEIIRKLMSRDAEGALRELVQLQDLGRAQVTELRAFVRVMQPAAVTPGTLSSAIREAVEHFERDSGITGELYCGDLSLLDQGITLDVLQIVREALNNTRKHSKASRVTLEVDSNTEKLRIRMDDDGCGFPFTGAFSLDELEVLRLGPASIKRRVRTLSGDLILESRPTRGTTLDIRIPVSK